MAIPRPHLIHARLGGGEELRSVPLQDKTLDEDWLQELLFQHPSILPVDSIDPALVPLISIGREIASIDNLFISPNGLLTIVETKLWRNSDAHRKVVAQIVDYAMTLAAWSFNDLDIAVQAYMRKMYGQPTPLYEIVKRQVRGLDLNQLQFEQLVQNGLTQGRFALLVVGDEIHESATRLAEAIQAAPHLRFSLRFVELHLFRLKKNSDWPLVVFPRFIAKTKEVERAVVTILYDEKKPEVKVKAGSEEEAKPGRLSFGEFIHALPADFRETFRTYVERWINEGYDHSFGTESFNLFAKQNGKRTNLFWFYTSMANLVLEERAKKLGLPKQPYRKYVASLMNSPLLRSAITAKRANQEFDTLSASDIAVLLKSTDELMRSISRPAHPNV